MEGHEESRSMDIMAYRARNDTRFACPHGKTCSAKPFFSFEKLPIYIHKSIHGEAALVAYRCVYAEDCSHLENDFP